MDGIELEFEAVAVKVEIETAGLDEEWPEVETVETMETGYQYPSSSSGSGSSNFQLQPEQTIDSYTNHFLQAFLKEENNKPVDVKPTTATIIKVESLNQWSGQKIKVKSKKLRPPTPVKEPKQKLKRKTGPKPKHPPEVKKPKGYTKSKPKKFCYLCPVSTPPFDYDSYREHQESGAHAHDQMPCIFCPLAFPNIKQEKAHLRTHAGSGPYICTLCPPVPSKGGDDPKKMTPRFFKNISTWFDHINGHRKEHKLAKRAAVHRFFYKPRVKCPHPTCTKEFDNVSTLNMHSKSHEIVRFPCFMSGCNRSFMMESTLESHLLSDHEKIRFPCTVPGCNQTFKGEAERNSHMKRIHTKQDKNLRASYPFACGQCPARYKTELQLRKHLVVHSDLPFRCSFPQSSQMTVNGPKCDEGFQSRAELLEHVQEAHEQRKKYQCQYCGKEDFSQSSELRRHSAICDQQKKNVSEVANKGKIALRCPMLKCPFKFAGAEMENHLREHVLAARVECGGRVCAFCKIICPGEKKLLEHFQIEHFTLLTRRKMEQVCKNVLSSL